MRRKKIAKKICFPMVKLRMKCNVETYRTCRVQGAGLSWVLGWSGVPQEGVPSFYVKAHKVSL